MALLPTALPQSFDSLNPFSKGDAIREDAPSLTIRELTGLERSIELTGRALPRRGVQWSGKQRVKTTWYTGNPQATQQVLGPSEDPTTLSGEWNDRFIRGLVKQSGFREVEFAQDMVEFLESIRVAGQQVEVEWGPQGRVGVLTSFTPIYDRVQDIKWEMEFTWSGRQTTPFVSAFEEDEPGNALLQAINEVSELFALGPANVFPDVNAILVNSIKNARENVATMFGVLRVTERVLSVNAEVIGAMSTAVQSLRLEMVEEMNRLAEVPVTLIATSTNAVDTLSAEAWRRDMSSVLDNLLSVSSRALEQLEARSQPPANQIFTAREETTLFDVSVKFYKTPDFAGFLREVNFRESFQVPAGTELLIPPKPNSLAS